MTSPSTVAIEAIEISKSFGHVAALRGANLRVHSGEVVALVGDNGAGKSTLMKVMCGALRPDEGRVEILGSAAVLTSVRDAHSLGVETVYQNLSLAPDLTVAESIFLGHEVLAQRWRWFGALDRKAMTREAADALAVLGIVLPNLDVKIGSLSGGQRQAVAVARAVRWAKTVIMMDEPTAALGVKQTEIVTSTIRAAAAAGLAVLVISHDMPRMLTTANRIAVMRHGLVVANLPAANLTIPEIVGEMLGSGQLRQDAS